MPSRSPFQSSLSLALLFSGLALATPAQAQSGAVVEFSVAPIAQGSPMQNPRGRVRLVLDYQPVPGVQLAAAQSSHPESVKSAANMTGPHGPVLAWEDDWAGAPGFVAAVSLEDDRTPADFDDRKARSVHWPIAGWPDEVGGVLRADAHADELDPDLRRLVESWLGARSRGVTPAVLAKYMAARVMTHAGPDLEPLLAQDDSEASVIGLRSLGVRAFARTGAGSEFDMLRAYAAALRIAGIPARLVVGARTAQGAALHAWVEFYLYDELSRDGRWVAVDLVDQRRLSPEPPPLADAWRNFGVRSGLIPMWFGVPAPLDGDPQVLAPWRLDCAPPCVPAVVAVRVTASPGGTQVVNAAEAGPAR